MGRSKGKMVMSLLKMKSNMRNGVRATESKVIKGSAMVPTIPFEIEGWNDDTKVENQESNRRVS